MIEDHRKVIADVSGMEPSPAIIELEDALLAGDPSLDIEDEGTPLRGYRLLEQIGTGAFSVVWRGIQPSVEREVAIKQIRSDLASQPEFIRRFEGEAHMVARIEHPHIVPLIDYWRDPDSAYLVMRWLRGGTLERRLDDGPLSLDETLEMATQIGGALSVAHERGVVHRDVKAANILFDEQGNAFLTDFGIALEVAESGGPEAALSVGSPAYASPEQIRREQLGPESDVFSLGVVVYECLSGSLPFRDSSSAEDLIERQLNTPYPPLSGLRSDIPSEVSAAVSRATEKDPKSRFSSVGDFLAALLRSGPMVEEGRATVTRADVANPYMGLASFDDSDADRFFGRERLVSELLGRLSGNTITSRCLVVVGPSGSGKSSVVRAGLTPALRSGAVPGSDNWFVTTMVPGADPFESLEAALLRVAVKPPESLLGQLRHRDRGLLRGLRRCVATDDDRVLLVIDQFEEVFVGPAAESADRFLDALSVAVEDPTSLLRLVVTLRADYYGRPLEHPAFARILKKTAVDVTPLAPDELERAIVRPARRVGVEFEPGLVARIAAETVRQPSPLPMLQYTLGELFDRRSGNRMTAADYDALGGLSGALAARAEAVYSAGTVAQKSAARRVLGRMTDPSAADLRRRVTVSDLGDDPDAAWVLEHFGAARLLSFDRDQASRDPTVEVAHEALLREWPRLVGWLSEDRELLLSADATALAADAWLAAGRQGADLYRGARLERANELASTTPERLRAIDLEFIEASNTAAAADRRLEEARVARLRRLVAGVAAALVVALVAGGVALVQQSRATDEAERAEIAAEEARTQASIAEEQTRIAEEQAEIAREQTQIALDSVAESELQTLIAQSAALTREQPDVSLLLALEAARRQPGAASDQAVLNALGSTTQHLVATYPPIVDPADDCLGLYFGAVSQNGHEFAVLDGQMVRRDLKTGAITEHGVSPIACSVWFGDIDTSRWFMTSMPPSQNRFGSFEEGWDVVVDLESGRWPMLTEFTALNRIVFANDDGVVTVVDGTTGEQVGPAIEGTDNVWWRPAVSGDGRHIALSLSYFGAPEGVGRVVVLDGETGEEVFRINTQVRPQTPVFDDAAGELLVGMMDGSIITVDIESQRIVSEVESGFASEVFMIGLRPDGAVVAIGEGGAELVDRRLGRLGTSMSLQGVDAGFYVLPDGRIVAYRLDAMVEVYDFDPSNALIDRILSVDDPATEYAFNDGRAGGVDLLTGEVRTVELATGERTSVVLRTPDGELFEPVKAFPETEGVSAVNADSTYARFEGETLVDRIRFDGTYRWGKRLEDLWAMLVLRSDGTYGVEVLDVTPGSPRVALSLDLAGVPETVHPTPDGGAHVVMAGGILETYDPAGRRVGTVEIGQATYDITRDSESGRLVIALEGGGLALVDPATAQIERIPIVSRVANLGFGRAGELLAITFVDGRVRLWDVERGEAAGLVWEGRGAVAGSPSWYDADTESVWIFASGKILQVPLNPDRWIEKACQVVGRELTQEEWDRYVPGDGPPVPACS